MRLRIRRTWLWWKSENQPGDFLMWLGIVLEMAVILWRIYVWNRVGLGPLLLKLSDRLKKRGAARWVRSLPPQQPADGNGAADDRG